MATLLLSLGQEQLSSEQLTRLRELVPPHLEFLQTDREDRILENAGEIEICAGWFDPKWLIHMPNLRWVHQWGAGVNWLMKYPDAAQHPFMLTNSSGVHAVPISEHIFGLLLAHGRNLSNAFRAHQEKKWAYLKHPAENYEQIPFAFSWEQLHELAEKVILLVGLGSIGERTAKIAKAFDMRVIGMRRHPQKGSRHVDHVVGPDKLNEVLPQADYIVLAVPLTSQTRHMFGEQAFSIMKPGAFLVNIGRGATIDQSALIRALKNSRLAGAGLDVFEEEPLPADSELWSLDNVIITSHYAGGTPRYHERAFAIFVKNLVRYRHGETLLNLVDKEKGY